MTENKRKVINMLMERTSRALEANNMKCYIADRKEDVVSIVRELVNDGETIACGGSVTLDETGLSDFIKSGNFNFIDTKKEGLSRDEVMNCYRESFFADTYFCSSNAITEKGELFNVDGNSNRVAAICFGPKSVIIVAGFNKIVTDIDAASARVKKIAAPANALRLDCDTYCKVKGECMANAMGNSSITSGCMSDRRICSNYVISGMQRAKNRIKVILVGEDLGY